MSTCELTICGLVAVKVCAPRRTTIMMRALARPTVQTSTQIMHALKLYYKVFKKYMWVHEPKTGEAHHRLARAGEPLVRRKLNARGTTSSNTVHYHG